EAAAGPGRVRGAAGASSVPLRGGELRGGRRPAGAAREGERRRGARAHTVPRGERRAHRSGHRQTYGVAKVYLWVLGSREHRRMTDDPAARTPTMTPDIVPTPTPHGADAATGRGPGLATRQIHAGYTPGTPQNTVTVPIYPSVAYEFDDFASARDTFALSRPGNIYSRNGNPTNAVLERRSEERRVGKESRARKSR